jgi:LytS/YehU family sensor histidine kinase
MPVLFAPAEVPWTDTFSNPMGRADLLSYFILLIYFYVNFYLGIPMLYFQRKYFLFILFTLLFFSLIIFVPVIAIQFSAPPDFPMHHPPHKGPELLINFRHDKLVFFLVFFFSLALRINARWKKSERERTSAELAQLKAQLNPHFLFNTLNTIYALSLEKSDETPNAVVRLSGMMRYIIGSSEKDMVPLEKEIKYVNDYIDLQKLRLGDTVKVDFQVWGNAQTKQIAPLILMPFVENAFKHGVNPEQESLISVVIHVEDHRFIMTVKNKILSGMQHERESSGLGLQITRNRLQHLYPAKHELTIGQEGDDYIVKLMVEV